jgi:hypothetical protein
VELEFSSPGYAVGRLVSLGSLVVVLGWLAVPLWSRRKAPPKA